MTNMHRMNNIGCTNLPSILELGPTVAVGSKEGVWLMLGYPLPVGSSQGAQHGLGIGESG